jgi:hypothetical protein
MPVERIPGISIRVLIPHGEGGGDTRAILEVRSFDWRRNWLNAILKPKIKLPNYLGSRTSTIGSGGKYGSEEQGRSAAAA